MAEVKNNVNLPLLLKFQSKFIDLNSTALQYVHSTYITLWTIFHFHGKQNFAIQRDFPQHKWQHFDVDDNNAAAPWKCKLTSKIQSFRLHKLIVFRVTVETIELSTSKNRQIIEHQLNVIASLAKYTKMWFYRVLKGRKHN